MVDPTSLAAISGTLDLVNKSVDLVRNLRDLPPELDTTFS